MGCFRVGRRLRDGIIEMVAGAGAGPVSLVSLASPEPLPTFVPHSFIHTITLWAACSKLHHITFIQRIERGTSTFLLRIAWAARNWVDYLLEIINRYNLHKSIFNLFFEHFAHIYAFMSEFKFSIWIKKVKRWMAGPQLSFSQPGSLLFHSREINIRKRRAENMG